MATTVTWLNDDNKTCVLTIQDGSNTTTALTPAAEPFTTAIQESDDIFTPIRSGNGYIRVVVDSVDDIAYLVGSSPRFRKVELTVDGVRVWFGFLACESFTQSWDKGPLEIELPVMTWLEYSKASSPSSVLIYRSFAKYLYEILNSNDANYDYVVFPNLITPATVLTYQFDIRNYLTAKDKNTGYDVASHYQILEDICKLFGLQAIEYGTMLVFMAADVKSLRVDDHNHNYNYIQYSKADLYYISQGSSRTGLTATWSAVIPTIFGADHDMTWLAGKKSVEVTGQLNERDETIWSMDVVGQCVYKGSDKYETLGTSQYHYFIKKYQGYTKGNIQVSNNSMGGQFVAEGNIKFYNFVSGNEDAYGGSIGYEKYYLSDDSNGHVITGGSDEWRKRLIVKALSGGQAYISHYIRTNFYYAPTQNNTLDAFIITGTLLYAANRQAFFEKATGTRYTKVALKIETSANTTYYWSPANGWTTTYSEFLLRIKDGEISEFGYYLNGQTLFVPSIPAPTNIEGQVTMNIIASSSTDVQNWPGSAYIAYEDLAIKLVASEGTRGALNIEDKEQREDENKKKIEGGTMFTEEWSQDCGLTLAREAVPDSYGVVLNANKEQPSSLYSNKWPEDALAERASNYFSKARLRIRAIVKSNNQMLSPLVPYTFTQGGKPYICIEQQQNWRTNEVRANFYEPTYNAV